MSFCGNCGANVPDRAVFCPNCGQKITATQINSETKEGNESVVTGVDSAQTQSGPQEGFQPNNIGTPGWGQKRNENSQTGMGSQPGQPGARKNGNKKTTSGDSCNCACGSGLNCNHCSSGWCKENSSLK